MMLAIHRAAESAGLSYWEAINVRLGARRIVIPDLVVGSIGFVGNVANASDVVLVSEILSPTNESNDRVYKLREYAEAGIPSYLLAEPDMSDYRSITLRLHRLDESAYVRASLGDYLTSDKAA